MIYLVTLGPIGPAGHPGQPGKTDALLMFFSMKHIKSLTKIVLHPPVHLQALKVLKEIKEIKVNPES